MNSSIIHQLSTIIHQPSSIKFTTPGVLLPHGIDEEVVWRSVDGKGGCMYINPTFDKNKERHLVNLYQESTTSEECYAKNGTVFIPSHLSSYCKKCKINRPPRCHHCSRCDRCVLQVRIMKIQL